MIIMPAVSKFLSCTWEQLSYDYLPQETEVECGPYNKTTAVLHPSQLWAMYNLRPLDDALRCRYCNIYKKSPHAFRQESQWYTNQAHNINKEFLGLLPIPPYHTPPALYHLMWMYGLWGPF